MTHKIGTYQLKSVFFIGEKEYATNSNMSQFTTTNQYVDILYVIFLLSSIMLVSPHKVDHPLHEASSF